MSGTLASVRRRTRNLLRDLNAGAFVFKTPEVDSAINGSLTDVSGRLRLAQDWALGALSLTAGTMTHTMPGTAQYGQVLRLRKQADALEIDLVSREEFDAWRAGAVASVGGYPQWGTLYEDATQALKLDVWPVPRATMLVDVLRSTMPVALTTDASAVAFDDSGLEALAHAAAASLTGSAAPEVLAQLGLSSEASSMFRAKGMEHERASRERRFNLTKTARDPRRRRRW